MNTGIGALSFDVTHSRLKSDAHDDSGQSYRATFNRMFTDTQTSIVLAAYRYSTKGYYNLNDALYAVDQEKNSRSNYTLWRQKRHDLHGEPEPAGRLGRVLSQRPYLRLLEPLRDREAVSGQLQHHLVVSPGRRARSASIRQTAPVIVATIVFHSTSATRCGLAITAPPT